jgi:hypothetical protein
MHETEWDGESDHPSGTRDASEAQVTDLSVQFIAALPVDGAAVSTLGKLLGSETISASSPLAARIDEVQFDLGEGPCWDAMRTFTPVVEPDLGNRWDRWPAFIDAIRSNGVTSIFAFPLHVGPLQIGAVDLFTQSRLELSPAHSDTASRLAGVVSRTVLRSALLSAHSDVQQDRPFSRRLVHQATGMVVSQLEVSADDAALIIKAHAFAQGKSMMEVAQQVIARDLDFRDFPAESSGA